ncbi:MAG: hypothetical protein EP319_12220 [Deltaproteobacteria bacterium]|nr:MAG: hypothetical protein EP319_12220 [Deltaproteobacteria bacterium]
MKNFVIIFLFFQLSIAFGAIPTTEGLFRNGNNQDIEGDLVVLTFIIEENVNKKLLDNAKVSETNEKVEETLMKETIKPRYFKVIYGLESEARIEAILVEYDDSKLSTESIIDVKYFSNILEKIAADKYIEREVFYSLLNVLALNDSRAISTLLTKYNTNFNKNEKLLNEEKFKLLNDYKKYLQTIKDDETLKEKLENPLKPEDPEKLQLVKEVMNKPLYRKDETVSLVKENDDFFWQVQLENTNAKFESKKLRMSEFVHIHGGSNIKINMGEYILFDGIHELPKFVFIKDLLERVFKVQITSYKAFKNTGDNVVKRYKKYQELVETNKKDKPQMATGSEGENTMVKLFVY